MTRAPLKNSEKTVNFPNPKHQAQRDVKIREAGCNCMTPVANAADHRPAKILARFRGSTPGQESDPHTGQKQQELRWGC